MRVRDRIGPYALVVVGLGLLGVAVATPGDMPGWATWPLVLGGIALGIGGGFWLDHRRDPIEGRTELAVRVLSLVAVVALFGAVSLRDLSGWLRVALAVIGVLGLAVVGYWTYFRKLPRSSDERERQIRHRAIYNAFVVVNGLLLTVAVVAFALVPPGEEIVLPVPTAVGLGSFAVFCVGVFVALFSEGWYRTRM